jgi:catechol 2,3-dioxygenase-like lactoylglutathione lyase family enzyme
MTITGFDHLAITVADVERTFTWYRDVLGAGVLYEQEWRAGTIPVVSLQIGDNRINVHAAGAPAAPHAEAPTPGSADLCFRWIGTVDAAQRLLAASGVDVVEGPVPRTSADGVRGQSVYFRDPDGNLLELLATEGTRP